MPILKLKADVHDLENQNVITVVNIEYDLDFSDEIYITLFGNTLARLGLDIVGHGDTFKDAIRHLNLTLGGEGYKIKTIEEITTSQGQLIGEAIEAINQNNKIGWL